MKRERVIGELKDLHSNIRRIIEEPPGDPTEIIAELEWSEESSIAMVVVDQSDPHLHRETQETYFVERGPLTLYVGEKVHILEAGDHFIIEPNTPHWARGNEAWVKVISTSGWRARDYYPVKETKKG